MTLDTKIKNYKINIKGKPKEIQKFLYILDEEITKGMMRHEVDEIIKLTNTNKTNNYEQFNFSVIHRAYIKKDEILLLANKSNQEFYFPLIEKTYQNAMQKYNKTTR